MLFLPEHIPSAEVLRGEGYDVGSYRLDLLDFQFTEGSLASAAGAQLRIAFLNLMPEKEEALQDLCRVLFSPDVSVKLVPLKFRCHEYKVASQQYMEEFYMNVEEVEPRAFDALLVNGAPVERLSFEEVDYWDELCGFIDEFSDGGLPQLYICWAAQAALYHFYGIPKYILPRKCFGVFSHVVSPAFRAVYSGLPEVLSIPMSRHTEIRAADVVAEQRLDMAAFSEESGVGIVADLAAQRLFITGHLEYGRDRLAFEYFRDMDKGLDIQPPQHYFRANDAHSEICATWHDGSKLLFHAWLKSVLQHKR